MHYTTLISTDDLAANLTNPQWAIFDCRFALMDSGLGRKKYTEGHIPGAIYAALNRDLAGPVVAGKTGRHPLPTVEKFVQTLSAWGIDSQVQVVAYDDAGGMFAARLWWMLRWVGHDTVAVLDGDFRAWQREGRPVVAEGAAEETPRTPRTFVPHLRDGMLATVEEVQANLHNPARRLLDGRSDDRFRGENETIDPIAGHIPSAVCAFYGANLNKEGHFLQPAALHSRFESLLNGLPPSQAIFYCGSGVSACHNLLAMEQAGLPGGRLYPGSWSEWIADGSRPVAKGE